MKTIVLSMLALTIIGASTASAQLGINAISTTSVSAVSGISTAGVSNALQSTAGVAKASSVTVAATKKVTGQTTTAASANVNASSGSAVSLQNKNGQSAGNSNTDGEAGLDGSIEVSSGLSTQTKQTFSVVKPKVVDVKHNIVSGTKEIKAKTSEKVMSTADAVKDKTGSLDVNAESQTNADSHTQITSAAK